MTTWDTDTPLAPKDPPHWFVIALAWLLIALFATALLAAIFVHVPETVRSRFVLMPENGAEPIQSPRHGVVAQVFVKQGQSVHKGDPLFLIRVDEVREWKLESDTRREELRALQERLGKEAEAYESALRIKDSEISQADREVTFRAEHLKIMQDLVVRVEKLAANGLMSDIELASHRLSRAQSEKDLEIAQKTLAQRRMERQRLEMDRGRQRNEENSKAADLRMRVGALQQPLSGSANGMLEIRAPFDGVCINVAEETAGRVIAAGDALCQLTPDATRLQARLDVPETGVSRVARNQHVRLLFDAFPYQRFGGVNGAIDWVSPAAVLRQQGSDFVALASLDRQVVIAGPNAYPLRPGMKGEARVTVGRRSLIEFAFEPLRRIRENLHP
ncbi:MAG TPA: HlyD family efflux transporter periplasmic adaptor subunit [Thermoanaerobaculia bacterium]